MIWGRGVDVQEIITAFGATRFRQACAAARRAGPGFGSSRCVTTDVVGDWDLVNDISEMVWDSELPDESKMALILEVYSQLPDFWLLGYLVAHQWQGLTLPARQIFWGAARRILAQDDEALVGPLTYSLGCDFFEDDRTCEEAWTQLVQNSVDRILLQRVLSISGPVPYPLREKLYERIADDPSWHHLIFRGLVFNNSYYPSSVDKERGAALLRRLDLPPDTEGLAELRNVLS